MNNTGVPASEWLIVIQLFVVWAFHLGIMCAVARRYGAGFALFCFLVLRMLYKISERGTL